MNAELFVFKSTHHTFKAERLLKAAKVDCKVMTKPRHISSECGLAVMVKQTDRTLAETALAGGKLAHVGVWPSETSWA